MVLAIASSFGLCLDLCLACPCLDRYLDPSPDPVFRAILICADDRRGRDRDPSRRARGLGPCLCRDPVDLCLGDRDLGIVNENANDVCSSYEKKNTSIEKVRSK